METKKGLRSTRNKAIATVAAIVIVGGVSGGAYAAVTSDKRALTDEYNSYSKSYAQVEGTMKNLTSINDGCVIDMNDEKLNPLCEDLDAAIKAVPEKVTIDLDKADVDKARTQVAEAQKALDTASANVDKAYEVAEPKLEAAREAFVAEVDKIIKETKTFIEDAQVIIDAAKEAKVDASELETAKVEAEKVVAELESDRDTMRRSTHTETVAELKVEKETVDVLASATLVVVADKDEKVAEKAVTTVGDTGRVSMEKAVEKVVEADQSGKLETIAKNASSNKTTSSASSVLSTAVATPKAQTTAQAQTNSGKSTSNGNTNSGKTTSGASSVSSTAVATPKAQTTTQAQTNSGKPTSNGNTGNYRTSHGQTTITKNGGTIYHDDFGYTDPQGDTHFQTDIDGQAMQDISDSGDEWLSLDCSGVSNGQSNSCVFHTR